MEQAEGSMTGIDSFSSCCRLNTIMLRGGTPCERGRTTYNARKPKFLKDRR
jgi:hypothetical protein